MVLVGFVSGLLIGYWLSFLHKNHRFKYYQNQLEKSLAFTDALKESNTLLISKVQRLQKLTGVDEDSLDSKIDRGIMAGIQYKLSKKLNKTTI